MPPPLLNRAVAALVTLLLRPAPDDHHHHTLCLSTRTAAAVALHQCCRCERALPPSLTTAVRDALSAQPPACRPSATRDAPSLGVIYPQGAPLR